MFPHTNHTELVILFERKNSEEEKCTSVDKNADNNSNQLTVESNENLNENLEGSAKDIAGINNSAKEGFMN